MSIVAANNTRDTCIAHFLRWNSCSNSHININIRHSFYIIGMFKVEFQVLFNKPTEFNEIKEIDGLGFVYALFVLHCENPKLFPLYDQHVWRSYLYFTKGHYRSVKAASQSWSSYELYSKWFINQLKALGNIDPTILDRALWAFGKELKKE